MSKAILLKDIMVASVIGISFCLGACASGEVESDQLETPQLTQEIVFRLTDIDPPEDAIVGIRGSRAPLNWDASIPLAVDGEHFQTTLSFEGDLEAVEYKYVFEANGNVTWESLDNRRIPDASIVLNDVWNMDSLEVDKAHRLLTPEELKTDLAFIRTAIFDLHPGTFRYLDEVILEEAFGQLERDFSSPILQKQAYFSLSIFLSKLQCDHTYANFYNQSRSVQRQILGEKDKLPFTLRWLEYRLIVTGSMSADAVVPVGSEIVSINGVSASDLGDKLFALIPADGPAIGPRQAEASLRGLSFDLEPFDVFQPFIIPPKDEQYSLEILRPDTASLEFVTVSAVTRDERSKAFADQSETWPRQPEDTWSFSEADDETAVLKVGTFVTWQFKESWQDRLNQAFSRLKDGGYANLIIDLRGNAGGADEPAAYLFERIVGKTCHVRSFEQRSRFKAFPTDLAAISNSWNVNWKALPVNTVSSDGYYRLQKEEDWVIRPNRSGFSGEVVILVDGHNASGGFYLARAAKACGIPLIGTTTGGSVSGISGGQIVFVKLPGSGLEFDLPVIGTFGPEGAPDRGIVPDIQVETTLADIVSEADPSLNAALDYFETL